MENFPSNSNAEKLPPRVEAEPKKIEQVASGKARKKSLGRRFVKAFIGGDSRSVMEYVVEDILAPAFKDMVSDAVGQLGSAMMQSVEKVIRGDEYVSSRRDVHRPRTDGFGGPPRTPYNRMSQQRNVTNLDERRRDISRRARVQHEFEDVQFETRREADDVLDSMYNLLGKYHMVSVKDFYEMTGMNFHHVDEKWGWTDLRGSRVVKTRDGYVLDLPDTEQLDV